MVKAAGLRGRDNAPTLDRRIFIVSFSVPAESEGATSGLQMEGDGE